MLDFLFFLICSFREALLQKSKPYFKSIDLRSTYVTQFLTQKTSGMYIALWDTFGSIIHCLKIM